MTEKIIAEQKIKEIPKTTLFSLSSDLWLEKTTTDQDAVATIPSAKNFVTLTGSVTLPLTINTVTAMAPSANNLERNSSIFKSRMRQF